VDDVEVDVVDAEALEAALDLGLWVLTVGIELGGDEDLVAGHAAVAQRPPDARLVAVGLGGVDVPVAELERPADRVLALGPVGDLPDPEREQRDLVAVGQDARTPVGGHCWGCHGAHSTRRRHRRIGKMARARTTSSPPASMVQSATASERRLAGYCTAINQNAASSTLTGH
jgi:hypothetical protein